MVSVVADHGYPGRFAVPLETVPGAPVAGKNRQSLIRRHAGQLERGERSRRVSPVVLAGNTQLGFDRLELLAAHDLVAAREPALEQLLHLGPGGERRMVVEVDVGEDGDRGRE